MLHQYVVLFITMKATTKPYITGKVTSADGTTIGYRQYGHGPAVLLVHGGMQAAQNFSKLATSLADAYTVYVPDRRGRGMSGDYGAGYNLAKEGEDIQALVNKSGAERIFGLSSGALITLQAAITIPALRKVALYEPPLSLPAIDPAYWLPRYEEAMAAGDLAAAMVCAMQGTGDEMVFDILPRFLLEGVMKLTIQADTKHPKDDEVPVARLVPTLHYDAQLITPSAALLDQCKMIQGDVLLLGGSRSKPYLKAALDALAIALPQAQRYEFKGLGHVAADNTGKPDIVAGQLRTFFAG